MNVLRPILKMLRIGNDPNSFNDQAELANIPIDQDFAMAEDLIDAVKSLLVHNIRLMKKPGSHGMLRLFQEQLWFVAQIWARSRDQSRQAGRFGLFPEVDSSDDDAGESDHDTSRDSDDAAADDRREENVVAIPF